MFNNIFFKTFIINFKLIQNTLRSQCRYRCKFLKTKLFWIINNSKPLHKDINYINNNNNNNNNKIKIIQFITNLQSTIIHHYNTNKNSSSKKNIKYHHINVFIIYKNRVCKMLKLFNFFQILYMNNELKN